MKMQELVNRITEKAAVPLPENTVDRLVAGDMNAEVTGVATTFMATVPVIRQAAALGANLIITHEPTWFNAADATGWLKGDPLYEEKQRLIAENGMNIWRFHDSTHAMQPDLIYEGMAKALGWEATVHNGRRMFFHLPAACTVGQAAAHIKRALGMPAIRVIGNPKAACRKAALLLGAYSLGLGGPGGEWAPMQLMQNEGVDLLLMGEVLEWTACAYVRDAAALGQNRAMIVLGHNRSEEAGMEYLVEWLSPLCPGIPVHFLAAGEPFRYL